jgi:FkbM family methyltransferase
MQQLVKKVKKLLLETPFEGMARWAYHRLRPSRNAKYNAKYDRETVAVMERCLSKNSNCIDIGCHKGSVLHEILRLAPQGTHFAFEPLPRYYQRLIKSYPDVNIYRLALSDVVHETPFQYVVTSPALSRFGPLANDVNEDVEQIRVRTDLLDNIVPREVPVRFIKIDVEGAELQVMRGAIETIRRNKPIIVFEHGLGNSDLYGTTAEAVYDFLVKDCGLLVSLMERWLKSELPLTRKEFSDQFYQDINYYFIAYEK